MRLAWKVGPPRRRLGNPFGGDRCPHRSADTGINVCDRGPMRTSGPTSNNSVFQPTVTTVDHLLRQGVAVLVGIARHPVVILADAQARLSLEVVDDGENVFRGLAILQ